MSQDISLLDRIQIASPCSAPWAGMVGDERVRFCGQCKLHVYNLSEMTSEEAEELIREREGQLCLRLYQRLDGTVLTRDCPVGFQRLRRAGVRAVGAVAFVVGLLVSVSLLLGQSLRGRQGSWWIEPAAVRNWTPFVWICEYLNPTYVVMGSSAGP